MPAKPEVQKRGDRRGDGVEKRPPGEAERDAARAEDNVPLDAATGQPIDPARGRMDRAAVDDREPMEPPELDPDDDK
jgi:hypothetical protein